MLGISPCNPQNFGTQYFCYLFYLNNKIQLKSRFKLVCTYGWKYKKSMPALTTLCCSENFEMFYGNHSQIF